MPKSVTFARPSSFEQHVLRLHVAVDEPVLVREREPARDLRARARAPRATGSAALAHDELLQVLAADELEDDVLPAVLLAPVDHGDDVRVRELRDRARLTTEPLDLVRVVRVALVEHLDGHVALEHAVVGPVDARHAPAPEDALESVAAGNGLADIHTGSLPALGAFRRPRPPRWPLPTRRALRRAARR